MTSRRTVAALVLALALTAAAVTTTTTTRVPDGTALYIGTEFVVEGTPYFESAVIEFDGTDLNERGDLGLHAEVSGLADNGAGRTLVTGALAPMVGQQGAHLAVWNASLSQWTGLAGGRNAKTAAALVVGTRLFVGVTYDAILGTASTQMYDGTQWTVIANVLAEALVAYGGGVVAGGSWDDLGGQTDLANIAMWTADGWTSVGGGVSDAVTDMTVFQGDLVVAGMFRVAGSVRSDLIVIWNGVEWRRLLSLDMTRSVIAALKVFGNVLYIGGELQGINRTSAVSVAGCTHAGEWVDAGAITPDFIVKALEVFDGKLYAGGTPDVTSGGLNSSSSTPTYAAFWDGGAANWTTLPEIQHPVVSMLVTCGTTRTAPGCLDCIPGYYSTRCLPCSACDVHGSCTEGVSGTCACDIGWAGDTCASCAPGYYGPACAPCTQCGDHGRCEEGLQGKCVCDAHWVGALCDTCAAGRYGPACLDCAVCNVNGNCTEGVDGACACDRGWDGATCSVCSPRRYGQACALCSTCTNGVCHEGVDGNCTCNAGWANAPTCDVCAPGFYGAACNYTCSACSIHGTCYDGAAGNCTCSSDKWTSVDCSVCSLDHNDPDDPCTCDQDADCSHGKCGLRQLCNCDDGWTGDYCNIGQGCFAPGHECVHGHCVGNNVSATCSCNEWYEGDQCNQQIPVDWVLALVLPASVFAAASVVYALATWHSDCRGGQPNKYAHNGIVYKVAFALLNFGTTVAFVIEAFTGDIENRPPAVAWVSLTFVLVPLFINTFCTVWFMYCIISGMGKDIRYSSELGWFIYATNIPFITIIWLISCIDAELLALYQSSLFGLSFFHAPWIADRSALNWLGRIGWLTIIFQDLPQLALQLFLFTCEEATTLAILTTLTSTIMLLFPIFEALMVRAVRHFGVTAQGLTPDDANDWFLAFSSNVTANSAPNGAPATGSGGNTEPLLSGGSGAGARRTVRDRVRAFFASFAFTLAPTSPQPGRDDDNCERADDSLLITAFATEELQVHSVVQY